LQDLLEILEKKVQQEQEVQKDQLELKVLQVQ
jgi:hypothetical protein